MNDPVESNKGAVAGSSPVPCSPFCGSDAEDCDACDHGIVRVKLDFEDRALVGRLEDHAMTHDAYEAILFWAIGRIRFLEANRRGMAARSGSAASMGG